MSLIPADRFRTFAPRATAGTREALEAAATGQGFRGLVLAQMFVESAGFTTREESLNYSVDGLLKMFGRHRISEADARKFGRSPVGRPTRTRSPISSTEASGAARTWATRSPATAGGSGVEARSKSPAWPTIARPGMSTTRTRCGLNPVASARAAANFFVKHSCIAPALRDDVKGVTLKVNGGVNGLDARIAATAAAKKVVGL